MIMIFVIAQTVRVGKSLTIVIASGFPLPYLWQSDTKAKQADKMLP